MSSSNLIRWSGLAALVGGALFVILNIVEAIAFGNQPHTEIATTGAWLIVQLAYIIMVALVTIGLVGLYVRQAKEAGSLGLIAFLIAFLGSILAAGSIWSEAFFGSWLAEAAPELLTAEPSGVLIFGVFLSYLLFALGMLLFGLASLRARVLPSTAAVLLMIGSLLFVLLFLLQLPFAGVVFGAAMAWLGFAIWSSPPSPALVSETA
jgi:hypothetical protein